MWNPTVGLGTVNHQYIGYLLPMGPFYVVFHLLGVPGLGGPAPVAGLHPLRGRLGHPLPVPDPAAARPGPSRWPPWPTCCRRTSCSTPGRISVILLPWAGLPFMVAFTMWRCAGAAGACPRSSPSWWRWSAASTPPPSFTSGSPPSCGWSTPWWSCARPPGARPWAPPLRIGILTLGPACGGSPAWPSRPAYGVNVLKYTETVPSTSATSNASEVLRGLGYWYFYGSDHLGPWTKAAVRFTQDIGLLHHVLRRARPVRAVGAPSCAGRSGSYFILLVFVGHGAVRRPLPLLPPDAVGRVLKSFMTDTTAGLALRSTDRATPVVAARRWPCCWAAGSPPSGSASQLVGVVTAVVVGGLVIANNPSLFNGDTIANNFTQPATLPSYQVPAIKHLNATHTDTRVLAIPGNDFASDRWGDTIDTPQPALLDPGLRHPGAADHGLHPHGRHPVRHGRPRFRRTRSTSMPWPRWPGCSAPATSWSSTTSATSTTASPSPSCWPSSSWRPRSG